MPNPTSGWDKVNIHGTYQNLDGTPKTGSVTFTLSQRVVAVDGTVIWPGGGKVTQGLASGTVSVNFPASDDPDIVPRGWSVFVEENLDDGSGLSYYVQPTLALGAVNLAAIIDPNPIPTVVNYYVPASVPVIVLSAAAPVPDNTPAGTVIVRTVT